MTLKALPLFDTATRDADSTRGGQQIRRFRHGGPSPYIDSVVMASKTEATGRNARPVATAPTISEFTSLRHEMRASAKRVPAGV